MDESRIEQILRQRRPDEPVYQPVPLNHAIAAPSVERVRRATVAVPQAGWQPARRFGAAAGVVAVVAVLAVLAVGMPSGDVGPAATDSPDVLPSATAPVGCVY